MKMRNQQLFEAPFVSEVGTEYCSKCTRAGAGKCMCKRYQRTTSFPINARAYSKPNHKAQWLFEAPYTFPEVGWLAGIQARTDADYMSSQRKYAEYRRLPGREPKNIGVLEIRADSLVSIVEAHREDVRALTGSNAHIDLANLPEPDGLGPITAGAKRYRMYLVNTFVTHVEPLSRAVQTPELVGVIARALQRHRLVSPKGTMINLSSDKPDDTTLKRIIFPR